MILLNIKKFLFISLLLLYLSFDQSYSYSATLTFNNDSGLGNNDWASPVNWGTGIIAGVTDTALVQANVSSISSGVASVFIASFSNGAVWGNGLTLTVKDMATFSDTASNDGSINGNATFNDTSYNKGTIKGDATFNTTYYSGTTAPLAGVLTVNGSNSWSGDVSGTVYGSDHLAITSYIFNNASYNTGTINGNVAFNGNSYNNGGTIDGNATFNTTYYSGTTAPSGGLLTINGSNSWAGNITGTVYGSDNQAITSYVFNNTSQNKGSINGNVTFNDTSTNKGGSINGNATFNTTYYSGTTAPSGGLLTINGSNSWAGNITGTVYGSDNQVITSYVFNNTSQDKGSIKGNVTFNDTSYNNGGNINGNATFNTTYYSGTTAPTGGLLTINGSNAWNGSISGTVYGSDNQAITSYVFNNTSQNEGTVNGNVTFNNSSSNASMTSQGTVNGNAVFNDISSNGGNVNGNATFNTTYYSGTTAPSGGVFTINGSNAWDGSISGTVFGSDNQAITSYVFNNTSKNEGTVKGSVTFNNSSFNKGGMITGDAIFNDTSYNSSGTINGNATFNGTSYNSSGSVEGNATFNTTYYSGTTAPTAGVFTINGSHAWDGSISGTVYGSDNQAITSYVFNNTSQNEGTVNGSVTFNNSSFNNGGTINGNTTFNDTSFSQGGTINGNATFNTTYYSGTTAPSGGVMTINGSNFWDDNVTGTIYGSDNQAITSYIFNNSSKNLGAVDGNATFNDSSYNSSGTINGNATFNNTSYNSSGTINGNATFNDSSYNDFGSTINGSVVFNSTADQSGTINAGAGTIAGNFSTTYGITIESGTVSSDISGAGDLTKTTNSTVVLTGNNSYTGLTSISAGTLQIGNNGSTGSLGTGNVINKSNLVFDVVNNLIVPSIIIGPGALAQNGTGVVTLSGVNTYTGPTSVNAGTLAAGVATQAFGMASVVSVAVGGTLDLGGFNETIGSLSGAGAVTNSGGTAAVLTTGTDNSSTTFSGNMSDGGTASTSLTQDGTGTFTLSGNNTYTGPTTLDAGILNLGSRGALGPGTINFNGGTLQYSSSNNIDYSGQFSTGLNQTYNIDTHGQNVTFASALNSSGGVLNKFGTGTLTLTNANNYSGGTTISAGTLQVENANALGTGAVTNNATLAIGTTNLSLNGAYTQNSGSALNLSLSASSYGNITSPSAVVAAASAINVTVHGLLPNNDTFEIINTGGAGVGSAPAMVTSNTYTKFTSSILNGNLMLTAENALEDYADNPNARAVGRDLDNINNPSSDMTNVLLKFQSLSNSQITAALNELGPIVDGGVVDDSAAILNNFTEITIHRVQDVEARQQIINDSLDKAENVISNTLPHAIRASISDDNALTGIWARPYGSYLSQGMLKGIQGYEAWNAGTVVGIDRLVNGNLTVGIAGGYANGGVNSVANNASTGITSAQGIVYAGYQNPDVNYFINAAGTWNLNWYKGQRDISFMNRTANAAYDGQASSVYVETGHKFYAGQNPDYGQYIGENVEFTPLVSMQWARYSLGRYTETSAGALDLNVNSQSYDVLESGLGADVSAPEKYDWGMFTPEIYAKWIHDYIGDKIVINSAFVNDGSSFIANGHAPVDNSVNVGSKLSFDFNNLTLIAEIDSEVKSNFVGIYGSGTVRYKF